MASLALCTRLGYHNMNFPHQANNTDKLVCIRLRGENGEQLLKVLTCVMARFLQYVHLCKCTQLVNSVLLSLMGRSGCVLQTEHVRVNFMQ